MSNGDRLLVSFMILVILAIAVCIAVSTINGQNRTAEVRKAEIEARCKFVGDEVVPIGH